MYTCWSCQQRFDSMQALEAHRLAARDDKHAPRKPGQRPVAPRGRNQ